MASRRTPPGMKFPQFIAAAACLASVSGCSRPGGVIDQIRRQQAGHGITSYADGPVVEYVHQPIPKPTQPLARTASLSMANWGRGGGFLFCDLHARAIGTVDRVTLPPKFVEQIYAALQLDDPYAEEGSRAAFELTVEIGHREEQLERALRNAKKHEQIPGSAAQAESLALIAWEAGEKATAHAYTTAAKMGMKAEQGKKVVRPGVARAFGGGGSLEEQYRRAWEWLHEQSGTIGPAAPEGTHLNVFLFEVTDNESFAVDSRSRVAVLLVLVDGTGQATSVIRGSDFLICKDECTSVVRKPTAKQIEGVDFHDGVKAEVFSPDAFKALTKKGFATANGRWQYLILHHALADLARQLGGAPPAESPPPESPPAAKPDGSCVPVDPSALSGDPVPDQAWGVAQGRVVCVVKADGSVLHGKLISITEATASVAGDGGELVVVKKAEIAEIRIETAN